MGFRLSSNSLCRVSEKFKSQSTLFEIEFRKLCFSTSRLSSVKKIGFSSPGCYVHPGLKLR